MDYKPIYTLAALQKYLQGATRIAFDFETSPTEAFCAEEKAALDAHKAQITGISFSVSDGSGIYLPLTHRAGQNAAEQPAIWQWLTEAVFTNTAVTKIAHNLAFESTFLYARTVNCCMNCRSYSFTRVNCCANCVHTRSHIVLQEPVYDTIAAAQLIYKDEKNFRQLSDCGLKTLVKDFFEVDLPSYANTVGNKHYDELDPADPATVRYACADADYTLRVYHLLNNWFDRFLPKHRYIAEKVESPTAVYVGLMRYNGLPVDRALMAAKQTEAEIRLEQLRREIAFIIGDIPIGKEATTEAFKRYLFDRLGLPKMKQTAKEKDSLNDEAIILLKEWCIENRPELVEMFSLVQEYRSLGKTKSTYIDGYLKHINSATGRLHPDLLPLTTQTGRFAAKNPNCQNMPRPGDGDITVRNFITAPEGKLLLSLDFSQIELRVGAFYCKDEKMLETYQTGGDIHALTTAVIYKIPLSEAMDKSCPLYKDRRTIAKNCNFGTFFGLYAKGLLRTLRFDAGLDVTLEECERIITNLKRGYPKLVKWQDEVKTRAGFRKYTETWLGRRRNLPDIISADWNKKSFAQRVAMNTPVQGTAADILKLALGRVIRGLPDRPWLRPLLQIHDELVFEIPENRLKEAAFFIKCCMEQRPFDVFSVPIVAEAAAGRRFGELKELEVASNG
jgi:DNA polymerase-1